MVTVKPGGAVIRRESEWGGKKHIFLLEVEILGETVLPLLSNQFFDFGLVSDPLIFVL